MKQISSAVFIYHETHYELVKYEVVDSAKWVLYDYSINGRGAKLLEFSDVKYSYAQAQHTASHMVRMHDAGVDDGRAQIRKELSKVIHG